LDEKENEQISCRFLTTILVQAGWEIFIDPLLKYSAISMKETIYDFGASLLGASIYAGIDYYKKKKAKNGKR